MENNGSSGKTPAPSHGSSSDQSGGSKPPGTKVLTKTLPNGRTFTLTFQTSENAEPIPYAGIRAGEITGYRAWRLIKRKNGRYAIGSVVMDSVGWKDGYCSVRQVLDTYPYLSDEKFSGIKEVLTTQNILDIGGGVHAFKEGWRAHDYGKLYQVFFHGAVIGKVMLWGEVIEHDAGWRAEHAKVVSFDKLLGISFWKRNRVLRQLREDYIK